MNAGPQIERLVDEAIHAVIMEFDPGLPESYQRCVDILLSLEQKVESSTIDPSLKSAFLSRITSHLAVMAFEAGNNQEAERLTSTVLATTSPADPDFTTAVLIRIKTLHLLGKHADEIAEAFEHVESGALQGHTLVHLLDELAKNHPRSIEWRDSLISRVKAYVSESPALAQRLERAQLSTNDPEEYLVTVAAINRRLGAERTARELEETSDE